jgi:hypothetical protein
MNIVVYSKIIDISGFRDKASFMERFLNTLEYNNYYAEISEDEINFKHTKDVTNLIFPIKGSYIPRILRSGKIKYEYVDPINIKVIWEIQFMPNIFFSFLWAFLSSVYYYFSFQDGILYSLFLFGVVFAFLCLISYLAIKHKVKQLHRLPPPFGTGSA